MNRGTNASVYIATLQSTSEILNEKKMFKLFCVGSGINHDSTAQHPLRTQEQVGY